MGKPKMWNISKTADPRVKRGRKFGTQGTTMNIWRWRFWSPILWVWFGGNSVHFAKFPILQFLKICSSPNFHSIHSNFVQAILIMGQYRLLLFLTICQKSKILWHFEIFHNTGHTPNFKRYLLWKYKSDSLPKNMHTNREGLYQRCFGF